MDKENDSKFVGQDDVDNISEHDEISSPADEPAPLAEDDKIDGVVSADAAQDNLSDILDTPKSSFLKEFYEWTQAIAVAVVLALIINQFVFSIVQVNGSSMIPTLYNNERLFVFKPLYEPKNKDIVIVKSDAINKYLVKRVIATEGQTIDMNAQTGDVYVDGTVLNEPYIAEKLNSTGQAVRFPYIVPKDSIFVMGDNRNNSRDSRAMGVFDKKHIIGKAVFRIWPANKFGGLYDNLK